MFENNNSHFINQRMRQIEDLSGIEEARRADHFLLNHLDLAVRAARQGTRMKIADESVRKTLENVRSRLGRLRDTLGNLHSTDYYTSRFKPVVFRGGGGVVAALLGR